MTRRLGFHPMRLLLSAALLGSIAWQPTLRLWLAGCNWVAVWFVTRLMHALVH